MPEAFFVALSVQLFTQLIKFITYSIRDRKISPKYLVTTGGMPSAHSAFVCALSCYIALRYGASGPWFSVSLVLASIVMYDAYRLRGFVQQHAKTLNLMRQQLPENQQEAIPVHSEMVGHSIGEILSGAVLGTGYAFILWFILH